MTYYFQNYAGILGLALIIAIAMRSSYLPKINEKKRKTKVASKVQAVIKKLDHDQLNLIR